MSEHDRDRPLDDRKTSCASLAQVIDLTYLPIGARPVPFATLDFEEVTEVRRLDCDNYGRCLDFVAHIKWSGFSCRRCPMRRAEAPVPARPDDSIELEAAPVIRLR